MNDDTTARLSLPLLQPGQAQKEMFHNEALVLLDIAAQPVVVDVGRTVPPESPQPGQCWAIGAAPTGTWTGHAHAIAGWTGGGWRFVAAQDGMQGWSLADALPIRFAAGAWRVGELAAESLRIGGLQVVSSRQGAIAAPIDGAVVDGQARAALAEILGALRAHGLIEG